MTRNNSSSLKKNRECQVYVFRPKFDRNQDDLRKSLYTLVIKIAPSLEEKNWRTIISDEIFSSPDIHISSNISRTAQNIENLNRKILQHSCGLPQRPTTRRKSEHYITKNKKNCTTSWREIISSSLKKKVSDNCMFFAQNSIEIKKTNKKVFINSLLEKKL